MTYYREFAKTPAGELLKAIQMRGRASVKELATDLGITPSAVRQHLNQLKSKKAIRAEQVREGVGRPYYVYSVTPQAHNLFQNDYGELAQLLLEEVVATQGSEALQRLLRRVSNRLAERYQDQMWGQTLVERLNAWAELLDSKGVLAEIERTPNGYILQEYGCPYQSVALKNRAICELERQVMARLLEADVRLTQCALDGYHGCQFAVSASRTQEDERQGDQMDVLES